MALHIDCEPVKVYNSLTIIGLDQKMYPIDDGRERIRPPPDSVIPFEPASTTHTTTLRTTHNARHPKRVSCERVRVQHKITHVHTSEQT